MNATIEDRLWQFALDVYGVEGVAVECLDVQDRFGVDVCVLLAAAFAATEGHAPDRVTIARWDAAVDEWRQTVVHPLRSVRRTLKPLATARDIAELRKAVQAAELQAERLELRSLAAAIDSSELLPAGHMDESERVTRALEAALSLWMQERLVMPRFVEAIAGRPR